MSVENREPPGPTIAFTTFGCRMNQSETAALAARFEAHGFRIVHRRQRADICVIHGCAVTETAMRAARKTLRSLARRIPRPFIVLAGCPVEAELTGTDDFSEADLVLAQQAKWDLPQRLAIQWALRRPDSAASTTPLPVFPGVRGWLRIQDGCDFNCAYCIVPRARGRPHSRPMKEILDEARGLVAAGAPELVLTGANIACFRDKGHDLLDVTNAVARVPGLTRLRLGSIEPATIETGIIALIQSNPRLCRSLHLPLQCGDDDLLRAMGRRYTVAQYVRTVEQAVTRIPDLGLGTDIICGLPGETHAAFERTRRLVEDLPFSNLHVFPYSERPGTRAAAMPNAVTPRIRRERVRELIALGQAKRLAFARAFIGKRVAVLIERSDGRQAGGWTSEYLPAILDDASSPKIGEWIEAIVHHVAMPSDRAEPILKVNRTPHTAAPCATTDRPVRHPSHVAVDHARPGA